jgi:murein L,D-transpeptidase YafK
MIKSFLILINLQILLFSSQQIILVVGEDFTKSQASLECYEGSKKIFDTISVNIGKNGLGWGLGEVQLEQKKNEPLKYEGDKKAPIGVFKLSALYGYNPKSTYKMPYLFTSQTLICVDDSSSNFYNQIIETKGNEKSFEFMKRQDKQYELGIVVEHNKNAIAKRGSCIFLHVKKSQNSPTAGCTAMNLEEIQKIAKWLDKKKNPILIQIPKSSSKEVLKLYPELRNSQLLQ